MHDYLTRNGLTNIAINYRAQMETAETITQLRRAEGCAMAIEHLVKECYPVELEVVSANPDANIDSN